MKKYLITIKEQKRDIRINTDEVICVSPVFDEFAEISLAKTVLKILKENEGEDVLIFEDDVFLTEAYSLEKLKYYADKYRNKIDFINTGIYLNEFTEIKPFENDNNLRKINRFMGTQAVYYLSSAYKKLLFAPLTHIDLMLDLADLNGVVTYPFMSYQVNNKIAMHNANTNIFGRFINDEKDERFLLNQNIK